SRRDSGQRISSGYCSRTRGLAANARFLRASVSSFFAVASAQEASMRAGAEWVSQGNASFARGLATTARLFRASESNTCPEPVETIRGRAAAIIASGYSRLFVFIISSFGCCDAVMRRLVYADTLDLLVAPLRGRAAPNGKDSSVALAVGVSSPVA